MLNICLFPIIIITKKTCHYDMTIVVVIVVSVVVSYVFALGNGCFEQNESVFAGFSKVGGLAALEYKYMRAVPNTTLYSNTTCGYPPHDAWHVFRHPWQSSYPSVGLILRTTFGSLWYWCANQVRRGDAS